MQTFLKVVGVVIVLYAALLAGMLVVMRQPVVFGKVMSKAPKPLFMMVPLKHLWLIARAGHLSVGDPAPEISLPTADKKTRVRLSAFRGHKPVVLVFGSYT
jgi:hypothetical protein